jgi:hypothetical protein
MKRIEISWLGPSMLRIEVAGVLGWHIALRSSMSTRLWNHVPESLRERVFQSPRLLELTGGLASKLLAAGRVDLGGVTPNAHRLVANPGPLWLVADSRAQTGADDFGDIGPLTEQASIGNLRIPQRGIFSVGTVRMQPPQRRLPAGAIPWGSCRLIDSPTQPEFRS